MKPIIVFGGSFNPPTNAHLSLIEQLLNDYDVQKVAVMPVGNHYNKAGLLPAKVRVTMLEKACESLDNVEISLVEVNAPHQLPTIETLELLEKEYPDTPIWFVCGTDNLRDLPNWDRPVDLLSKFKILVLERDSDKVQEIVQSNSFLRSFEHNIMKMNEEVRSNCSSTLVRRRLKEGKYVKSLLPERVYSYIKEHRLYEVI